jgi:hypothetical protein
MLLTRDIIKRMQSKLDDPDGTYLTEDYVMGFVPDVYEWMFNKISLFTNKFDEEQIVLPAVPAGTRTLDAFQLEGQPLAMLVTPTMLRWRLPGLDDTYWRKVDGPLDYPRDVAQGMESLDSWAWNRYSVKLSNFSTALDIEVTGSFLFDPLTSGDDPVQIAMNANRCFSTRLSAEVAAAREMWKLSEKYEAWADDALDDLVILMTKAMQRLVRRVGRISRPSGNASRVVQNH